jgi:Na+/H+-dicarboxylate symporter
MKKSNLLTIYIFVAMILGISLGYVINATYTGEEGKATIEKFSSNISILTDIFLRLIKMIIAPLVFSTLVVGVAKLGDIKAVGRIGGKTMLWFISATFVSLFLGLILVNLLQPGANLNLTIPDAGASSGVAKTDMTLKGFFQHVVPDSVINAMAHNEILPIVVFSIFFGVATAAIGEAGLVVVKFMDSVAHIMLKVTGYVMNFAPFAVFGAMAATIAEKGPAILLTYGKFIGQFYIGLSALWVVLIFAGFVILGRKVLSLLGLIKDPILLAFSTASSEAAYPRTMEGLEKFGCDNRIVSFVLPLGYSFNLDGSMMYMTFASLFIAQAYGVPLGFEQQISMLLVLMITSKGIAGVPRASLVVIAGTLSMFHIPEAGLLLLLGVDHFLDMGRSATNVIGNAMATAVVSKWESGRTEGLKQV